MWSLSTMNVGRSTKPSPSPDAALFPDLYEASLTDLQRGLEDRHFTSVHLVKAYLARIDEVNVILHAIIETNPSAVAQAQALDTKRQKVGSRGPLHGIPIIVKDNLATGPEDGMNTTAGSYALVDSVVPRDSFVVARLRAAGAIILGKANMHVGNKLVGARRAVNEPLHPNGDAEGSSSGSAIAAAIGLAGAALGTETDGSIIMPACRQNIVGLKPTVGLTSRAGVIPCSEHQDSIGILARSVTDAAIVLTVIAGMDPRDKYTLKQPIHLPNYLEGPKTMALQGIRLGVPRCLFQNDPDSKRAPEITIQFNQALKVLETLGATVVDPVELPAVDEIDGASAELTVLFTEFKDGLERYMTELIDVPSRTRTLEDLIAFNCKHQEQELPPGYNYQDKLIKANSMPGFNETYQEAVKRAKWLGSEGSIDYALRTYNLDALVMPSRGKTCTPAALAGYPTISVPLGFLPENTPCVRDGHTFFPAPGIPFGIAFTGLSFTEPQLLKYAFAFEQHTLTRLARKAFPEAVPKTQLIHVM